MSMQWILLAVRPEDLPALEVDNEALVTVFLAVEPRASATPPGGTSLHLGKDWDAIDFLLARKPGLTDGPYHHAVMGGREFGTEDLGYGPPQLLEAAEVSAIAAALAALPVAMLRARYDAKEMDDQEVYPIGIWQRDGQHAQDDVLRSYAHLVDFYAKAAASGCAVLQAIV